MTTIRMAIVATLLAVAWPPVIEAEDAGYPDAGGLFALGVNLPLQPPDANVEAPSDPGVTGSITQATQSAPVSSAPPQSNIAAISVEPEVVRATASEGEVAPSPSIEAARPVAPPAPIVARDAPSNDALRAARSRAQQAAKARVARRDDATTGKILGRALDQPGVEILNSPLKSPPAPWF
ncbi:MAG: hypothetical protein ACT4OU_12140 [Hyphomicrobium sp.]